MREETATQPRDFWDAGIRARATAGNWEGGRGRS